MEQISDSRKASLGRMRALTGLAMAFERLWPLLLPSVIAASALLTLSWSGLFRVVPDTVRFGFLALVGLSFVASLWPLRRFRLPLRHDIDARIEAANQLSHQPIAAQSDRPAGSPDDFANALWREHQRRMAESLSGLQSTGPSPKVYTLDRFALRAIPALGLAVAFAYSHGSAGGRISDIWNGPAAIPPVPPRIDAWVTPPRYTGKAPLFLTGSAVEPGQALTMPENSEITIRVAGETGTRFSLAIDGKPMTLASAAPGGAGAPDGHVLKGLLLRDGVVSLESAGQTVASWAFKIVKDSPPAIAFTADPSAASNGSLALAYKITDDYGAVKAVAQFKPADASPDARPLYDMAELALSIPRRSTGDGVGKTAKDLTQHPLAGEAFEITLRAEDGAGQTAVSAAKTFVLPEFYFASPLARALAEDRRLLARDANDKPRVLDYLDALMTRPDETLSNASHFLGVKTARIRLAAARTDDQLRDVADYLWELAREIDKNSMSDAQRRLKQAQDKLAQALENGASDQEIEKLMQELRQAMNDYMKQLAEEAEKNPQSADKDKNSQELRASDLDKMLDKLEDLAKQGSKDQAKQLLSQLNDLMNNLQAKKGGKGGKGQSEMEGKLDELGKMLRDQKKLLDETYKQGRQSGNEGDGGEMQGGQQGEGSQDGNGQGKGPQPGDGSGMGDLARRQNELGQRLNQMMEGLKGLGLDPGQELSDAGKAMGRAGQNLGEGDANEAARDQSDALDSLRKGAQGLMDQMRQAMGQEGGGQQKGERGPGDRDPLGRPRATDGPDMGQATKLPDEIDVQRAREILEAIRKRLGDALSPEAERNYLERLLKFE